MLPCIVNSTALVHRASITAAERENRAPYKLEKLAPFVIATFITELRRVRILAYRR